MRQQESVIDYLAQRGVSRRSFLKFCVLTASALALPAPARKAMAQALGSAPRPSVIWLSFQECTGCTESLTRSVDTTIESLILNHLSLDYHHTLQAAAGHAAESARVQAMEGHYGRYVLVVDGSIPTRDEGAWSTIAGITNLQMLAEAVGGAALVLAVGTCAAYGGLPRANPNPSGAMSVQELMQAGSIATVPLVNLPGCPPVPEVIAGVIAHYVAFGTLPELDSLNRPLVFYGKTVHDCCPRRPAFDNGVFAKAFDDDLARGGACLLELGCKGPVTFNACATVKWNMATSLPMHSGHGCLGCSEPHFWDRAAERDGGFYEPLQAVPAVGDGTACAPPPASPLS
jgi:hydrogenase small subunit